MFRLILFFICILVSLQSLASGIETKLSTNNVAEGDSFTLSFIQHDRANNFTPDFSALEKDFKILSNNYGSNFQTINGVMSAEVFWQLTLAAKRTGDLIIPPIRFGNALSNSVSVKVTGKKIANDSIQYAPLMLKAEVSDLAPYVQSQIIYTLKMYYQTQLNNTSIEIPQTNNLTFVDLGKEKNYQTTLNGKTYAVIEKQLSLFVKNSGEVQIPASHLTAITYDATNNFNGAFLISTPRPVTIATNTIKLKVRPVPKTFKGGTWLPSPQINLTDQWSSNPSQWQLGDPITRTIIVEAVGLRADQIPDLNFPSMLETNVYTDTPKRENKIDHNQLVGRLEQTITYIFNASHKFNIPAVSLDWWNTQTDRPEIAEIKAFPINIIGTPARKAMNTPTIENLQLASDKSVSSKAIFQTAKTFIHLNFWYVLLLVILLFGFKVLFLKIKRLARKVPEMALTEKMFLKACQEGNAKTALAYLSQQKINDEALHVAMLDIQKTLYAKNPSKWSGETLLKAYQAWKSKQNVSSKLKVSPLPPLNPLGLK